MRNTKVVIFLCNWNAYSGFETAGREFRTYSSDVHPVRVLCLGRISIGIILKAFERGARGVMLLGCPNGECRYEFGNKCVENVFTEACELIKLLGFNESQLKMDSISAGDGEAFEKKSTALLLN